MTYLPDLTNKQCRWVWYIVYSFVSFSPILFYRYSWIIRRVSKSSLFSFRICLCPCSVATCGHQYSISSISFWISWCRRYMGCLRSTINHSSLSIWSQFVLYQSVSFHSLPKTLSSSPLSELHCWPNPGPEKQMVMMMKWDCISQPKLAWKIFNSLRWHTSWIQATKRAIWPWHLVELHVIKMSLEHGHNYKHLRICEQTSTRLCRCVYMTAGHMWDPYMVRYINLGIAHHYQEVILLLIWWSAMNLTLMTKCFWPLDEHMFKSWLETRNPSIVKAYILINPLLVSALYWI